MPLAPPSEEELLRRAHAVAGLTLAELAKQLAATVPAQPRRAKGWAGALLESALGASAGPRPLPDFPHLGIELKTLPVNTAGQPLESTYVCTASLAPVSGQRWEDSVVRRKLQRVLWMPIVGNRDTPPTERRIGTPLLWRPDADEERWLHADWEELMELIALGRLDQIDGRHGRYLQLRPKAAHARELTAAIDADGVHSLALPRGFYLRARFTRLILERHYYLTVNSDW
jgi:DNA mismatch repair protein MutH